MGCNLTQRGKSKGFRVSQIKDRIPTLANNEAVHLISLKLTFLGCRYEDKSVPQWFETRDYEKHAAQTWPMAGPRCPLSARLPDWEPRPLAPSPLPELDNTRTFWMNFSCSGMRNTEFPLGKDGDPLSPRPRWRCCLQLTFLLPCPFPSNLFSSKSKK